MRRAKSTTKTIGSSSVGTVPYKVVRISRSKVNIIISRFCANMLCERGADLSNLENIGGKRARNVMKKILSSVEEQ